MILLGRRCVDQDLDHQLADLLGDARLVVAFGRDHRRAAGADPQRLEGTGHRVGGELAATGTEAGAGDALELVQFLVAHVARVVGADRLEDVEDGDVAAVPVARGDRAAVEQDRGHVEPGQRHRAAGDRLVAGAEGDDRVELVPAGHQLDRVGDHLATDQRGLHPLSPHRHPVGDGDGVELHRRSAGREHTLLDVLGQGAQPEVAGHRLGPGVGDPDRRPAQRVVVEADPLHVSARVGAVGAVEDGGRAGSGEGGLSAVRTHARNLLGVLGHTREHLAALRAPEIPNVGSGEAEGIDRTRAGADATQASAHRLGGHDPGLARSLQRLVAVRQERRQRRGMSAARAVRGAIRMPLAGNLDQPFAIEEEVDQVLAMAAGDDDRLRSQLRACRGRDPPGLPPRPARSSRGPRGCSE